MPVYVRVESYCGHKAHERLLSFSLGRKKLLVTATIDQWHGPDHIYFKVLAEDANSYIVRYHHANDQWEMVYFKASHYGGEFSLGIEMDIPPS
jgi:hypothetical protein